uniref:Uncharacterized protein n=1 Tax=Pristionchus pacificus TaxID=54126 RepID=A0A2A6CTI7_PRIPA|eukprot:PDM81420.1 hypothetical protein PRIPAC_35296 [Pristionchus pacificus]
MSGSTAIDLRDNCRRNNSRRMSPLFYIIFHG